MLTAERRRGEPCMAEQPRERPGRAPRTRCRHGQVAQRGVAASASSRASLSDAVAIETRGEGAATSRLPCVGHTVPAAGCE